MGRLLGVVVVMTLVSTIQAGAQVRIHRVLPDPVGNESRNDTPEFIDDRPLSHTFTPINAGGRWPGRRGYGCDRFRQGCDFVVWQQVSGKTLTETQVRTLIEQGHTRLIRGFLSPKGQKFAARLQLDNQGRTVLAPAGK